MLTPLLHLWWHGPGLLRKAPLPRLTRVLKRWQQCTLLLESLPALTGQESQDPPEGPEDMENPDLATFGADIALEDASSKSIVSSDIRPLSRAETDHSGTGIELLQGIKASPIEGNNKSTPEKSLGAKDGPTRSQKNTAVAHDTSIPPTTTSVTQNPELFHSSTGKGSTRSKKTISVIQDISKPPPAAASAGNLVLVDSSTGKGSRQLISIALKKVNIDVNPLSTSSGDRTEAIEVLEQEESLQQFVDSHLHLTSFNHKRKLVIAASTRKKY